MQRHTSLNLDSRPCFRWLFNHLFLPPHRLQEYVTIVRSQLAKYQLQRISNKKRAGVQHTSAYVSIRQHTSAYVSIRQHTSAYLSIRQHTSAYVSIRQHTSAYVSIRQQTSVYVSIRPHTSTYGFIRDQRPCVRVRGGPRLLVLQPPLPLPGPAALAE